jgi:hypothetical protein
MPRYRIIVDDLPFGFECGDGSNTNLQARRHLTDFKFNPTSLTLQKIVKHQWIDVCRRNLETGFCEWPNDTVTSSPMELPSPIRQLPERVPLTGAETIPEPAAPDRTVIGLDGAAVAEAQRIAPIREAQEPAPWESETEPAANTKARSRRAARKEEETDDDSGPF